MSAAIQLLADQIVNIIRPGEIVNGISSGETVLPYDIPATEPTPRGSEILITATDGAVATHIIYLWAQSEQELVQTGDDLRYSSETKRWSVVGVKTYKGLLGTSYVQEVFVEDAVE